MEPEGPEIGQDNLAGTRTIGQPLVQQKEHTEENEGNDEKERTDEKECTEDMVHTVQEQHAGPHPGNVPILVPGIDQGRPDAIVPSQGTGKKTRIKKKPVTPRPVTEVHRKTEIFGASGNSFPEPAQVRRHTERNLRDPGFGISYPAAEKAVQDLVCSLVERQDRMNAGIMLDIKFMQEDIGILQDQVYKLKTMKSGATAAGEKK